MGNPKAGWRAGAMAEQTVATTAQTMGDQKVAAKAEKLVGNLAGYLADCLAATRAAAWAVWWAVWLEAHWAAQRVDPTAAWKAAPKVERLAAETAY
jgi:hypothetical protein